MMIELGTLRTRIFGTFALLATFVSFAFWTWATIGVVLIAGSFVWANWESRRQEVKAELSLVPTDELWPYRYLGITIPIGVLLFAWGIFG